MMAIVALVSVTSQGKNFGAGAVIGAPTGITFKYFLSDQRAIDGTLSWSFRSQSALSIYSSYLIQKNGVFSVDGFPLGIYYGLGGAISTINDRKSSSLVLAARTPVGLNLILKEPSVEFFTELAPVLEIIPATEFSLNLALGARIFF